MITLSVIILLNFIFVGYRIIKKDKNGNPYELSDYEEIVLVCMVLCLGFLVLCLLVYIMFNLFMYLP